MNFISAVKLASRSIVKVSGRDCYPFIQTLVTNDIRRLMNPQSPCNSLYAHFVNSMGRSLSDVIIYKTSSEPIDLTLNRFLVLAPYHSDKFGTGCRQTDRLYLECPSSLVDGLKATLLSMRLRRDLTFEIMSNMDVWSLYPSENTRAIDLEEFVSDDVIIAKDPRIDELGYRFVSSLAVQSLPQLKQFLHLDKLGIDCEQVSENDYAQLRYKLGVPEGSEEIVHGFSFPLECNVDYFNGISFKKGMHTADWITSRNWRKGVQKRMLPIEFDASDKLKEVAPGSDLVNLKDGSLIGELRARKSRFGLGSINTKIFRGCNQPVQVIEPRSKVTGSISIPTFLERELLVKPTSKLFAESNIRSRLPYDTRLEPKIIRRNR